MWLFASILTNEIVIIKLLKSQPRNNRQRNPPLREYHLQKQLLCSASKAFNLHFNSRFPSPKSFDIYVEQVDQEILETFIAWVYNVDLDLAVNKQTLSARKLIDLYLFADNKGCNRLKNDVIDLLQDSIVNGRVSWELKDIAYIFSCPATRADSCWFLRRFAAHSLFYGSVEIQKFEYNSLRVFFDMYPEAENVYTGVQQAHWNSGARKFRHPLSRDRTEGLQTICTYHIHDAARGESCRSKANTHLFAAASLPPSPPPSAPNSPPYYYYN
jgi:hypothetical protein